MPGRYSNMRFFKTYVAALVAVLLVAVFFFVPGRPASADPIGTNSSYPLYADQDLQVGNVLVWNNEDNLFVQYMITEPDWYLKAVHLMVADQLHEIPQWNGNPLIKNFTIIKTYDIADRVTSDQFYIGMSQWQSAHNLFIAAQASVGHVSQVHVEQGSDGHDATWWSDARKSNIDPSGYIVPNFQPWRPAVDAWEPPSNLDPSNWDKNLNPVENASELSSSDWIWESHRVSNAESYTGDIVFFKDKVNLPKNAFDISSELYITSDNAYYFYLNGDWTGMPLGMAGFLKGYGPANFYYASNKLTNLGGGTDSRPYETLNHLYPKAAAIDTGQSAWSTVERWDLTSQIDPGKNELQIVAINAHAPPQKSDQNPAGLIYNVEIDYSIVDQTLTAWAADGAVGQQQFPGNGWATYIDYDVQGWVIYDEIVVFANNPAGRDCDPLQDDILYKFIVAGTWTNRISALGPVESVDAGYVSWDGWVTHTDAPQPPVGPPYTGDSYPDDLLSLQIDQGFIGWNPYSAEHHYQVLYTGTGDPVNFRVFDGYVPANPAVIDGWYTDNVGTLEVYIFAWE